MENVHLTFAEDERQYYAELFAVCDADNTGKASLYRALELFRTAKLSPDALNQILDQCDANQALFLSPKQFYTALKLIAAVQVGLPLQLEVVNSGMELPLPRFTHPPETGEGKMWPPQYRKLEGPPVSSPDLIQLSDTDGLSTPPQEVSSDVEVNSAFSKSFTAESSVTGASTGGAAGGVPDGGECVAGGGLGSPSISSTASDSPTPTNSTAQEKTWASSSSHWQGLMGEEHRQLLGTEEESSDRHSSGDNGGERDDEDNAGAEEGEEKAADGEEEDEEDYDVWSITQEQQDFYTSRFLALQQDLRGVISGPVAKHFFEKSKLPVQELRKIWQLADVTKDGALSLEEFYAAMHLVVLRRHNIDLPDTLPPCLAPHSLMQSAPSLPPAAASSQPPAASSSSSSTHSASSQPNLPPPPPPPPQALIDQCGTRSEDGSPGGVSSQHDSTSSPLQSKEWTKFADSPTSTISSPGPKPVNFDFQKSVLEQDPKILHPVPVRLTPESQSIQTGIPAGMEEDSGHPAVPPSRAVRKVSDPIAYEQEQQQQGSPKKVLEGEIRPIQRPQPKKPAAPGPGAIPPPPPPSLSSSLSQQQQHSGEDSLSSTSSSSGGGLTTSTTSSGPTSLPMSVMSSHPPRKGEPPPPPPPRPYRTHGRSSSLDLNRLGRTASLLGAPPAVPPRISPSATSPKKMSLGSHRADGGEIMSLPPETMFADFSQLKDGEVGGGSVGMRRHGAFEVYRKPVPQASEDSVDSVDAGVIRPKDRPNVIASIRHLRQHNNTLLQLNQELNADLAATLEERMLLERQLEHMMQ